MTRELNTSIAGPRPYVILGTWEEAWCKPLQKSSSPSPRSRANTLTGLSNQMFKASGSIAHQAFPKRNFHSRWSLVNWSQGDDWEHRAVSAERERTLRSLVVESDHMPWKAANRGWSQTFTNGRRRQFSGWGCLLKGQQLTRPTFSNGPMHPLPCGKRGTVCSRQNNNLQRCPPPNPQDLWEYARLYGKEKIRLQVKLRLIIS